MLWKSASSTSFPDRLTAGDGLAFELLAAAALRDHFGKLMLGSPLRHSPASDPICKASATLTMVRAESLQARLATMHSLEMLLPSDPPAALISVLYRHNYSSTLLLMCNRQARCVCESLCAEHIARS